MTHYKGGGIDWSLDYHQIADDFAVIAVEHPSLFSPWEREFLATLHLIHYFSDPQVLALERIAARLGALAEAAP